MPTSNDKKLSTWAGITIAVTTSLVGATGSYFAFRASVDAHEQETARRVENHETRLVQMERYGHEDHERRITKLEARQDAVDTKLSDLTAKVDVCVAILQRIDPQSREHGK